MSSKYTPPGDHEAEVVENRKLDDKTFLLALCCPGIARAAEPGQFALVRPGTAKDPFLGRPLAVAAAAGDTFKMIVRVTGRGTALLASKRRGEVLTVRGLSGRGFWAARGEKPLPERVIFAGGSVGAAPLVFAARRLGSSQMERWVAGVAGEGWEGLIRWIKQEVPEAEIYSDDGTLGKKGTALSGLPASLPEDTEIWACGPAGMLKALAAKYPDQGGQVLVSLESRMACGMGGCLGCVIPTLSGSARVCADGPVFSALEVKWDELPSL